MISAFGWLVSGLYLLKILKEILHLSLLGSVLHHIHHFLGELINIEDGHEVFEGEWVLIMPRLIRLWIKCWQQRWWYLYKINTYFHDSKTKIKIYRRFSDQEIAEVNDVLMVFAVQVKPMAGWSLLLQVLLNHHHPNSRISLWQTE